MCSRIHKGSLPIGQRLRRSAGAHPPRAPMSAPRLRAHYDTIRVRPLGGDDRSHWPMCADRLERVDDLPVLNRLACASDERQVVERNDAHE